MFHCLGSFYSILQAMKVHCNVVPLIKVSASLDLPIMLSKFHTPQALTWQKRTIRHIRTHKHHLMFSHWLCIRWLLGVWHLSSRPAWATEATSSWTGSHAPPGHRHRQRPGLDPPRRCCQCFRGGEKTTAQWAPFSSLYLFSSAMSQLCTIHLSIFHRRESSFC